MSKFFYTFARIVAWPIMYLLYWFRFEGRENLKYKGRMLLYANHLTFMDVVLIGFADRHCLRFMAKKELFRNRLFARIITWLGAFEVDRESGLSAMSEAIDILKADQPLLIFPEGARNLVDEEIHEFHPGIVMIAQRAESKVLPILITQRPKRFRRNVLKIGAPISLEDIKDETLSKSQNTRYMTEKLRQILEEMR